MKTILVGNLRKEINVYHESLPVVVSVEGKEYPISDVFLTSGADSGSRIVVEAYGVETPSSMGKKGGTLGGKIGGKAQVKKGFAMSGKSGRKPKSEADIAAMPETDRVRYLKRRERYKNSK